MRGLLICALLVGCGSDSVGGDDDAACPTPPGAFPAGDPVGHPDPLGAGPTEARAGRIRAADLPVVPSGLVTWQDGDFVLANDKVALVIEDVGDSDLYDPWGGRPVGLARVEGGALVEPANFGEALLLTGRSTIVTDSVSVIADGSDGGTAIIRARGKLHPLPFFEAIIAVVYPEPWLDIDAAIDYELAPGAEHVDIRYRYGSPRDEPENLPSVVHAFMYTDRMPVFQPGKGFDTAVTGAPYMAFIDDAATSWAYLPGEGNLGSTLATNGFLGAFSPGFEMPACGTLDRLHAKLVIGGPGLDGVQAAVARVRGEPERAMTGTVTRDGQPVAGIHVHAIDRATGDYLTRATTAADGSFTVHVPEAAEVRFDAVQIGTPITSVDAPSAAAGGGAPTGFAGGAGVRPRGIDAGADADASTAIALPPLGQLHVVATDDATAVPVRIQVFPTAGAAATIPDHYGEDAPPGGRQLIAFAVTGEATLDLPPGSWDVVVSRGYEYELVQQTVTITAGAITELPAALDHSVDTTGTQCADFHIHTWRSADSGDDSLRKVAQAVADGLELPVRADHEFVADFKAEIAQLGVGAFAAGFGSVELTSMEVWGHMGVFPLTPDASRVNAGAPLWQSFPTATDPTREFATLSPPVVFDAARARPESPVVIINHPRGGANYFEYVGYDPVTGLADLPEEFDTKFTLVEVFNDSAWLKNRERSVADWFGLLRSGRKVFATGSSDSHTLASSPTGYPRTCLAVGTDDPTALTANQVRDTLAAGHATVSGGVYVSARIGEAAPGDTTTGAGSPLQVDVTVRAATWIDVDAIDVVVDGVTVDTIPIMPGDADPGDPTIRFHQQLEVQPAATGGFVVIAAYGDQPLEPVHPGRLPFGATNPIFVTP